MRDELRDELLYAAQEAVNDATKTADKDLVTVGADIMARLSKAVAAISDEAIATLERIAREVAR